MRRNISDKWSYIYIDDYSLIDDKTVQYAFNYDKQFNGDSQHRFTFDFQYENSEETEASIINQNNIAVENVDPYPNLLEGGE